MAKRTNPTKKKTTVPKPAKLGQSEAQLMRTRRREIMKQQAHHGKQTAARAAAVRDRRQRAFQQSRSEMTALLHDDNAQRQKLIEVVGASTIAVLASEGIRVSMTLDGTQHGTCFTDFRRIVVAHKVDTHNPEESAAVIRGLIYHEGGHCKYTINPKELLGVRYSAFHRTWNLLEDQRMEMAVAWDSPRKVSYFVPLVLNRLLVNLPYDDDSLETDQSVARGYVLLVQRRYLPKSLRKRYRRLFAQKWGEEDTLALERISHAYVTTNDRAVMVKAVEEMQALLTRLNLLSLSLTDTGTHSWMEKRPSGDAAPTPVIEPDETDLRNPLPQGDEGEQDDDGQPSGGNDKQAAGDDEPVAPVKGGGDEADGDEADGDETDSDGQGIGAVDDDGDGDDVGCSGEGADGDTDGGDADEDSGMDDSDVAGDGVSTKSLRQTVQETLDAAKAERNADTAVQRDIRTWNECKATTGLNHIVSTPANDNAMRQRGENIAADLVEAFKAQFADRMPAWQEQQTRGILNVNRYITRKPGDREFWRQWTDADEPGTNLSVSLLLDRSGSMKWAEADLSVIAYACKRACDDLNIPCTVVLWDEEAEILFSGTERAHDVLYVASMGGTEITKALSALSHMRHDKDRHLMICMTDGEWEGVHNIAAYMEDGDHSVGLFFSQSSSAYNNPLQQHQFSEVHRISNLNQIASYLRRTLEDMA